MTMATQALDARLYIGNCPYSATEQQLTELLKNSGIEVSTLKVAYREGRPQGFAFAEGADKDAERAILLLDGKILGGRRLRIERARPRSHDRKSRIRGEAR